MKNFTSNDIADLMTTAVEGGSTFWCRRIRVLSNLDFKYANPETYKLPTETTLLVVPSEDDAVTVRFEHIQRGLDLLLSLRPDFDMDNHDAEDADIFFQGWVFGEVVYG